MNALFLQFLLAVAMLTAFDAVWFLLIMNKHFLPSLRHLLDIREGHVRLRWFPAILVYGILAFGMIAFVLPSGGILAEYPIFVRGAIFGLVVFGTYEGTNGALLKDWPRSLMAVDLFWGALTCGVTAMVIEVLSR